MANYETLFSAGIDHINADERAWIEQQLDPGRWTGGQPPEWDAPVGDESVDFEWSLDGRSPEGELGEGESYFWVRSEESGSPVQVGEFVRAFLARFRPDEHFVVTYADVCSKPRIGEFSGGALLVTKDELQHWDAYDWVEARTAELLASRAIPGVTRVPSSPMQGDAKADADNHGVQEKNVERVQIHWVTGSGWIHTHGLTENGFPELEIRHVPGFLGEAAACLLRTVSDYMLENKTRIEPGETVSMPPRTRIRLVRPEPMLGEEDHYTAQRLQVVDIEPTCDFCGSDPSQAV